MDKKAFRRLLRKNQTKAESVFWYAVRGRKLLKRKFRRQFSIAGFIVDFICLEEMLVIEIDGEDHLHQADADFVRDEKLCSMGYQVVRFTNEETLKNIDLVIEEMKQIINKKAFSPGGEMSEGQRGE